MSDDDLKALRCLMQAAVTWTTLDLGGPIPRQYRASQFTKTGATITIQGETNLTDGWVRYAGPEGEFSADLIEGERVGKPAPCANQKG